MRAAKKRYSFNSPSFLKFLRLDLDLCFPRNTINTVAHKRYENALKELHAHIPELRFRRFPILTETAIFKKLIAP